MRESFSLERDEKVSTSLTLRGKGILPYLLLLTMFILPAISAFAAPVTLGVNYPGVPYYKGNYYGLNIGWDLFTANTDAQTRTYVVGDGGAILYSNNDRTWYSQFYTGFTVGTNYNLELLGGPLTVNVYNNRSNNYNALTAGLYLSNTGVHDWTSSIKVDDDLVLNVTTARYASGNTYGAASATGNIYDGDPFKTRTATLEFIGDNLTINSNNRSSGSAYGVYSGRYNTLIFDIAEGGMYDINATSTGRSGSAIGVDAAANGKFLLKGNGTMDITASLNNNDTRAQAIGMRLSVLGNTDNDGGIDLKNLNVLAETDDGQNATGILITAGGENTINIREGGVFNIAAVAEGTAGYFRSNTTTSAMTLQGTKVALSGADGTLNLASIIAGDVNGNNNTAYGLNLVDGSRFVAPSILTGTHDGTNIFVFNAANGDSYGINVGTRNTLDLTSAYNNIFITSFANGDATGINTERGSSVNITGKDENNIFIYGFGDGNINGAYAERGSTLNLTGGDNTLAVASFGIGDIASAHATQGGSVTISTMRNRDSQNANNLWASNFGIGDAASTIAEKGGTLTVNARNNNLLASSFGTGDAFGAFALNRGTLTVNARNTNDISALVFGNGDAYGALALDYSRLRIDGRNNNITVSSTGRGDAYGAFVDDNSYLNINGRTNDLIVTNYGVGTTYGISADNKSGVNIDGRINKLDIKSYGIGGAYGIYADDGSTVTIEGRRNINTLSVYSASLGNVFGAYIENGSQLLLDGRKNKLLITKYGVGNVVGLSAGDFGAIDVTARNNDIIIDSTAIGNATGVLADNFGIVNLNARNNNVEIYNSGAGSATGVHASRFSILNMDARNNDVLAVSTGFSGSATAIKTDAVSLFSLHGNRLNASAIVDNRDRNADAIAMDLGSIGNNAFGGGGIDLRNLNAFANTTYGQDATAMRITAKQFGFLPNTISIDNRLILTAIAEGGNRHSNTEASALTIDDGSALISGDGVLLAYAEIDGSVRGANNTAYGINVIGSSAAPSMLTVNLDSLNVVGVNNAHGDAYGLNASGTNAYTNINVNGFWNVFSAYAADGDAYAVKNDGTGGLSFNGFGGNLTLLANAGDGGDAYGFYNGVSDNNFGMISPFLSSLYINADAHKGGDAYGIYTSGDGMFPQYLGVHDMTIIADGGRHGDSYAIFATRGSDLTVDNISYGPWNPGTVMLFGDLMAEKGANLTVNLDTWTSFLYGMPYDRQGGDLALNFSNWATWYPTGNRDQYIDVDYLSFENANINLAFWELQKHANVKKLKSGDLNLRTITLEDATLKGVNNLVINSDVKKGKADSLVINDLNHDSDKFVGQNVILAYDPVINSYLRNGIGGNSLVVSANKGGFIPVFTVGDLNGTHIFTNAITSQYGNPFKIYDVTLNLEERNHYKGNDLVVGITGLKFVDTGVSLTATEAAEDTIGMIDWTTRIISDSLMSRMGDVRLVDSYDSKGELWAKAFNSSQKRVGVGEKIVKQDIWGGRVGIDKKFAQNSSAFYLGGAIDYATSSNTYGRGTGSLDSYGVALYGNWFGNNGVYVSGLGRYGVVSGDYDVLNVNNKRVTSDYETEDMELSMELGYRGNLKANWFVEPHAQYTYTKVNEFSARTNNKVRYDYGEIESQIGKAGLIVGREFAKDRNLYIGADYYHNFNDEGSNLDGRYHDVKFSNKVKATEDYYSFKIGGNISVSDDDNVYFDVSTYHGEGLENNNLTVNLGVLLNLY